MKNHSALWPLLVATPLLLTSCGGGTSGDAGTDPENMVDAYALRIQQPILDPACVRCHAPGGSRSNSPLTGYDEVLAFVKPGNPTDSELLKWITTKSMAKYATAADREAIAAWIAEGAPRWAPADSVEPPGPPAPARTVGMKACLVCHGTSLQFVGWLQGAHGNVQDLVGYAASPGTLDSKGYPYYGQYGLGTSPTCTTACHDPLGDGQNLTTGLSGNEPRPVVGCESCHGGGANHYGQGPIPFPRPDFAQCGPCHDHKFAHNQYYPEGDEILEKYVASPHASSLVNPPIFAAGTADVQALCSKCHTDEGARRYKNVAGGYDALSAALPPTLPPLAGATPVQCRTCHDPHDPLKLLLPATVVDGTVRESAEYRTCIVCHQTADALHGPASAYAWSKYAVGQGTFNASRVFYDTHFDDPTTDVIEGYVLDPKSNRACRDCHDVHASNTTINRQWARSGHGGGLLVAKEKAEKLEGNPSPVFAAGVGKVDGPTTAAAGSWAYYDFKEMTGQWDGKGRQACQYCHTATGFRNFADNLITATAYDPTKNAFTATGKQRELLYCWACHTDSVGGVRNPKAFLRPYATPDESGAPRGFADIGSSNVCVPCHAGRQSGEAIKAAPAPTNVDFGSFGSHYLAGSGILYRTIGYEFPGRDYKNVDFFQHTAIGTVKPSEDGKSLVEAVPGTGKDGPCVACHMTATEHHLLKALARDSAGKATGPATTLCSNCHLATPYGDYRLTAELLQEQEEGFHGALLALEAQVILAGFHYSGDAYPYFFANPFDPLLTETNLCSAAPSNRPLKNWQTGGTSTWAMVAPPWGGPAACSSVVDEPGAAGTGANNLGAAFNLVLLKHEPGAYAHNRFYTKRLIFDSLDWLDNGVLDGTIDLSANSIAAAYLDAGPAASFNAATVRRP